MLYLYSIVRQGSGSPREYLPPIYTQKPRPFGPSVQIPNQPESDHHNFIGGYPPSGSITPEPPFPVVTSPVTGGVVDGNGKEFPIIPPLGPGYPPSGETPHPPFPPIQSTTLPPLIGYPAASTESFPGPGPQPGEQISTIPPEYPSVSVPQPVEINTVPPSPSPLPGETVIPESSPPSPSEEGFPPVSFPTIEAITPAIEYQAPHEITEEPGQPGYPGEPVLPAQSTIPPEEIPVQPLPTYLPVPLPTGLPTQPPFTQESEQPLPPFTQTPVNIEESTSPQGVTPPIPKEITPPPETPTAIVEVTQPPEAITPSVSPAVTTPQELPGLTEVSLQPTTPEASTPEELIPGSTLIPQISVEDLKHPPHVHAIDVECAKDMMTINIEFNREFNGIVYSKGFYTSAGCHYVRENSGQTRYSFTVSLNSCGTEFVNAFDTQGRSYLENVLVLQNEAGIQEVIIALICTR